jgi:hypothetical protein
VKAAIALAALALLGCGGSTAGGNHGPATTDEGLTAFETMRQVFQHPRCQNCHPAGDVPLQGDDGRLHNQLVQRGPTGHGRIGEECTTCHGPTNPPDSYGAHTPPGVAKGWHMPKPEVKLVFVGMAPGALCEQVKDPARNGGMDMAALRHHLEDPLVTWGWKPGFGRTPIPIPYETFVAAFETWARAGAPCPP